MGPYVDRLIVAYEETLDCATTCIVVYPVPSHNVLVVDIVIFCLVYGSYESPHFLFDILLDRLCFFNKLSL